MKSDDIQLNNEDKESENKKKKLKIAVYLLVL